MFFTHQSFQEFLAAQYAWEKPEAKNQVIGEMWQPRWREVLKFLVWLDESGEMLRAIYPGPDMDNVLYSRLFLAAQCLSEDIRGETAFSREVFDGLMDLAVKPPFISQAVTALIRLDIPSNRKRLIQLLANQRFLLLEILNQGPPLIQKIVYLLEPFLKDENPSIRFKVAAIILDILKNMPRGWVPAMAQGLEAEDVPISESAIVDLTQHLEDKE